MTVFSILLIVALVMIFCHAVGVTETRVHLAWLGVALIVLAWILGGNV